MWMVRTSQGHPGRLSDKSAATRAPPYDGRAAAYGEAAASLGARKKQIAKSPIPSSRRLSNQTSQTTRGHNAITDTTITTTARPQTMPRATKASQTPVKASDDTKPYPKSSTTSPSPSKAKKWSHEDKLNLLLAVIKDAKPDWKALAGQEPFQGRTHTQVSRVVSFVVPVVMGH
jgi:hypothetical protein